MRIYTRAGDLAFKTFIFPDGQPHFKLETYEVEFEAVTVEMAIKSPSDLLQVLMVSDVLRQHGYAQVHLAIRYLMGARMDRAIDTQSPFTLRLVAKLINGAGFTSVRILDVHSEIATKLIRNSSNVLPKAVVQQVVSTLGIHDVIIPDKGAHDRVFELTPSLGVYLHQCFKERDPKTGALSNFRVPNEGLKGRDLLIIDDICDGGGTFVGLATELKERGAKSVNLFVTHNVQGKDRLDGIDKFFTTNSFDGYEGRSLQIDTTGKYAIRIPISMKDL